MDPDEALAEIRRLSEELIAMDSNGYVLELVELIGGLDYWIAHGGFLPKSWRCD